MKRTILFLQMLAAVASCFITVSANYLEYDSIKINSNVTTSVSEQIETLCLHNHSTKNLEVYHNENGSWIKIDNFELSHVVAFTLSSNGRVLTVMTRNGTLSIYEKNVLNTWNSIPEFTENNVDYYSPSSQGTQICIKQYDRLRVIEKQHGVWYADDLLSCQDARNVYLSDDKKTLILITEDSQMCLLTRESCNSSWTLIGPFNNIEDFKISENGKTLCMRTDEKFLIVEQDQNGLWNKIKELPKAKRINFYSVTPDGTTVIIKTDKRIIINDKKDDCWFQTKSIETSGSFDIAPSGKLIAVVQNKKITLYEQSNTTWEQTYQDSHKTKNVIQINVFDNRNIYLNNGKEIKTLILARNTKSTKPRNS